MSIPIAYTTIVVVWSTTPIAIAWSAGTISPSAALGLRMAIAAIIGVVMMRVMGLRIDWQRNAMKTYLTSLLGIFMAMSCVYQASKLIPSGLISVLFALAPLTSTLFGVLVLKESQMNRSRLLAFAVSFTGLLSIFSDELIVAGDGWVGVLLLLAGVAFYSLSGVLVQKINYRGHPMQITVGSLLCSLPFFVLSWWVLDGKVPEFDWSSSSPWAVLYLAVFGSLLGFCAYFYVLRQLGATSVAMVTLMTPVLALFLGGVLNDEQVSAKLAIGTVFILAGLLLYYKDSLFKGRRVARITPPQEVN